MNPSVLISGAGGNFGPFVLSELVKNSERFSRIAILCREERKEDFSPWLEKGVEVIIGSMTDSASYRGNLLRSSYFQQMQQLTAMRVYCGYLPSREFGSTSAATDD